ncbi:hypothetical protein N7539_005306 [Penicillium diatomitis]|uniref:Homeobox domain-containing protein n=1 Tax=Penicillium diatomitis TaxID=2819901 RepID=A0A9W9X6N2_9EURO|nr:uncharacterized protein N7539_005306 [Penicillium diatomitis]KAJ5485318.1 hypothetical protein N7539_005306 [Penicillium diatomitis]
MSQPRALYEDNDMAISYTNRVPAGHPPTLPSFRELLPPHLHDEIDSSVALYNNRPQSQDRPASVHEAAIDPRSMPNFSPTTSLKKRYGEHTLQYTTRSDERLPRPVSDHYPLRFSDHAPRGPSPILPPLRDFQSMNDRKGLPEESPTVSRSEPFAQDFRAAQSVSLPGPVGDRRHPDPYTDTLLNNQPPFPPSAALYPGDSDQMSPNMLAHSQQANFGIMGDSIDPKTKRRRGNLPKPVTDILRAWFHEHLDHPYPSEEDKQMFMTRTGLSISQISNWFINARRRQLPALRNQMRTGGGEAESSRHSPFSDVEQEPLPSPR